MSDLYLHLRRRLTEVAEWTDLGVDVMRDARKAKGLSYEAAARQTNISSKTYERREKQGRWPTHEIDQLARALDLEIDRPSRQKITIGDNQMDRVEALLEETLALLRSGSAKPERARSPRRRRAQP